MRNRFGRYCVALCLLLAGCGSDSPAGTPGDSPGATGGTQGQGGGPSGGGASNSGGSPVVPTLAGARYQLAVGNVTFEAEAPGGRITTLSLGGTNLLQDATATGNTINWGSTLWTSPQAGWDGNTATSGDWPPPVPVDSAAYTGGIDGTHVVLTSPAEPTLGITVTKDLSADAATGWITILYTVSASKAVSLAPWEVSRVARGGIAFFPAGSTANPGPLTLTGAAGVSWFDDTAKNTAGKAVADGSRGWLAHVFGGVLFLKKFEDVPAAQQAPNEGEIEFYADSPSVPKYMELEVQGPLTDIPAGGSLAWTMKWRVAPLPAGVTAAVGSPELLAFVEQELAR